ncbi:MAG: acyltransferase [Okeania sp. SIO2C2]|uniref:acyltransferase family protein n=1 Tax=Okeania sp. SIO2C2 TaxID=2607787 RepID=UPI0013B903D0|nr:acyltransferase family protein [Okeania sp. SIO2C2]NEP91195.1 acyltransferase [Okeania sp. SIO2C2]
MLLKQQDIRFDILKSIGIICIVLAHTMPRDILLFQLRNFDVPLMVLVSGSLFYLSSKKANISYTKYLKKRLFRLVPPVWLFLTLFFLLTYLTSQVMGIEYQYSLQQIVNTYLCIDFKLYGVWYTWIIRVFALISLIAPLILGLWQRFTNKMGFFLIILGIYSGYELLYKVLGYKNSFNILKNSNINPFIQQLIISIYHISINQILFYVLPYGCLFGLGILAINLNRKDLLKMLLFFLGIFITLSILYSLNSSSLLDVFDFQKYKYPPRIYYIAYSLVIWASLYLSLTEFLELDKIDDSNPLKYNFARLFVFISSSTMWIYLWHILVLHYWSIVLHLFQIPNSTFLSFTIVFSLSVIITALQKFLIANLIRRTVFGTNYSSLLTTFFMK